MIRLLVLAANPRSTDPLRLGEEVREIESKLRTGPGQSAFKVQSAWAVTTDELMYQLNAVQPNIIHFSGHGTEDGQIVLEDSSGQAKPLSVQAVKLVFANFSQWLQVVVLNACYSAALADALVDNVDAVVGMKSSVLDAVAITFSANFYRALGFGRTVQDAFSQAVASLALEAVGGDGVPVLRHRAGVDPALVRLMGESNTALALRRAEDPRVPEHLRQALRNGSELIVIADDDLRIPKKDRSEDVVFLGLRLRQSQATYVIEVSRHAVVSRLAELLAENLLRSLDVSSYDWSLVRGTPERAISGQLSVAMANLRSGDWVKLTGNHNRPTWAPSMR